MLDVGGQRRGDRAGAALGDHPSLRVRRAHEHHPDRAGHRAVQPGERVRGDPGPQRPGLLGVEQPGHRGGRECRPHTEADERQRMARHSQQGLRGVGEQRVEPSARPSEDTSPPLADRLGGPVERVVQHAGGAVVERVGAVDLRLQPRDRPARGETERGERRRSGRQRMDRRAVVDDQAGDDQLRAAHAATDRLARLQHGDVEPGTGQHRRADQPVRPAADDDRGAHRSDTPLTPARRRRGRRRPGRRNPRGSM